MNPISMVALGPDDADERDRWLDALTRTVDSNAYCLGREVDRFEARCRDYLDVPHALGCSNGTDAIRIGLQALGIGVGDEVIVPATSFFASASAVAQLGAKPVFVDVDAATLTIDPDLLDAARSPRTKVVMPVHLYGQGADLDRITAFCEAHDLAILEDAAQCFGARYRGRALGSIGKVGTFSFYPTKNLAAPGDAGMMVTTDADLAERLTRLRVHGDAGGYRHEALGWNARMDGFQAAVLSIRLERYAATQAARARNAESYLAAIEASPFGERIRPLGRTPGSDHIWHQFIVQLPDRDGVRAGLAERNIASGIYYPSTLPAQPVFADLGYRDGDFPVAERACRDGLALPVHHRLAADDPARVIEAISKILKS